MRNIFLLGLCLKRNIRNFWLSGIASSLLKYKKFFKLGARKLCFLKYNTFFHSTFFYFSNLESYFQKYKATKFHFQKYKKVLFLFPFSWKLWGFFHRKYKKLFRRRFFFFFFFFGKSFEAGTGTCSR